MGFIVTVSHSNCLFCNLPEHRIIAETELFWVIRDGFPVTDGHTLIIPKRHTETWFDLTEQEQQQANQVLTQQRRLLLEQYSDITGFNIGMNCGESAGQTVICHILLIPFQVKDFTNRVTLST